MKRILMLLCATAIVLTACTAPKEKAKQRLEKLHDDVTLNADSYDDEDWMNFLVEYHQTDSLLSLYEYSDEELQQIGKMKGKCAAYLIKAKAIEAKAKVKAATQELKGAVEGFLEGMQDK